MPESPFLLSSVVPACGFCLQVQSRSRGVKESRSWQANRRPGLSGSSLWRRRAIPGLPDSSISRPRNLASEQGGTTPKKHKNNTNEASMLLKTKQGVWKRTQNELKNEPNLRCLGRELMPNSGVVEPIQEVGSDDDGLSLLDPQLSTSRLEFAGTKRECL